MKRLPKSTRRGPRPQPTNHQARLAGPPSQPVGRWVLLALCVVLAGGASYFLFVNYIWSPIPAELAGKWVVTEGEQQGATFDFWRNGDMEGTINVREENHIVEARVRVEDGVLYSTTQHPRTGQSETRSQKIKTLNATDLVLEDERGQLLKLRRAQ